MPIPEPTPEPAPATAGSTTARGAGSSPLPGCIILVTVCLVFGSLLTLFTVVYHLQSRRIVEFTDTEPVAVPLAEAAPGQADAALEKLRLLRDAAESNRVERVLFSAADLNALIATQDLLADFRGQTHVRSISIEGIEAAATQTLRTGFLRQSNRHLNGIFRFQPEIAGKTVLFRVTAIDVPGREVPEGFVRAYPDLMKLDPKREGFREVLPKLGAVYLEGESLVVETRALPSPP